ncbi:MAG: cation:proton antiporter, partial [Actinomycetota bacterium]
LVARPLAVFALLVWSRTPVRRMAVISWAGLRGAVPVVLATIPFTAGHPDGALIFDVTFVVVVISVAVQGPTVGVLARRLGVVAEHPVATRPEIIPVDANEADIVEVTVHAESRLRSVVVADDPPPSGSRIITIQRDDETIVPHGSTRLEEGDVLLVIVPRSCGLVEIDEWSATAEPDFSS